METDNALSGTQVTEIVDAMLNTLLLLGGEPTFGSNEAVYVAEDATPELRASIEGEVNALDAPSDDDALGESWRLAMHKYIAERGTGSFGHDMALTRNSHGAGFWDRGMGEVGELLTDWAKSLGTLHVFHGSDAIDELKDQWSGKFHAE